MTHVRHRFTVEEVLSNLMGKMIHSVDMGQPSSPATSVLAQWICVQTGQGGRNGGLHEFNNMNFPPPMLSMCLIGQWQRATLKSSSAFPGGPDSHLGRGQSHPFHHRQGRDSSSLKQTNTLDLNILPPLYDVSASTTIHGPARVCPIHPNIYFQPPPPTTHTLVLINKYRCTIK